MYGLTLVLEETAIPVKNRLNLSDTASYLLGADS